MCLDQKLLNISYIMGENSGSYIIAMMPLDTCSIFCLIQNTILDYVQAIDGDSDNPRQIIYQFTNSKFCQLIHQQESLFLAVSLWTKFYFLNSPFFSIFIFTMYALYWVSHNKCIPESKQTYAWPNLNAMQKELTKCFAKICTKQENTTMFLYS